MNLIPYLRKKFFVTIVWVTVTLQLFNISFDPADPFCGREDLSVNEIESCIEMVLEIVLGHEDAIEENDESDEAPDKPGATVILFSLFYSSVSVENPTVHTKNYHPIFKSSHIESLSLPITAPPPKFTSNLVL
jgi:hypothetical protein